MIENSKINKVAELTPDKQVIPSDHHYGKNQGWKITFDDSKKAYQIISVSNPDLTFTWDSNHSGQVIGYEDHGYSDQYWRIEKTPDGFLKFKNYKDPKIVLDAAYTDYLIANWEIDGEGTQDWALIPVNNQPIADGEYQITSKEDPNKVADLTNNAHDNVVINDNHHGNNQKWRFTFNKDKQAYRVVSVSRPDLAFAWGSHTDSPTIFGAIGDFDDQYWSLIRTTDGYFQLRNYKNPHKLLSLTEAINETTLIVWDDWDGEGKEGQKWSLKRVDAPIIPNGKYNISSKLNYRKVVDHDVSKSKAVMREYIGLSSQGWEFKWNDSKKAYTIHPQKNDNLGLVYQNKNFPVIIDDMDDYNQDDNKLYWIIEYDIVLGGYVFRSLFEPSQVLDSQGGYSGMEVISWGALNKNQVWNLMPIDEKRGKEDIPVIENGIYNIATLKDNKKKIASNVPNKKIWFWEFPAEFLHDEDWIFEWDSLKKAYKISARDFPEKLLYFQEKESYIGLIDKLYINKNSLQQYWTIEHDIANDGYVIRSLYEPSQVLDSQGGNYRTFVINSESKLNNKNQLWNLISVKDNK
ncbi:hypothetical protein B7C51_03100 [Paenibacillus larvae subsp. pulvifaciens]|uniref:Ricin B lectin domain-containing protein n=1 Tax=Paenibacillus larvae subsp. pulvifaciens TaxID=1477 RepID=A0A1V0UP18_9BACL|nr:RICIN domain-containing protein [Paenibacillus larvae]ARF67009.1 hypothetical protein B7C51_03100 [Paenibacillus larvae subsp. pulvifaciens]